MIAQVRTEKYAENSSLELASIKSIEDGRDPLIENGCLVEKSEGGNEKFIFRMEARFAFFANDPRIRSDLHPLGIIFRTYQKGKLPIQKACRSYRFRHNMRVDQIRFFSQTKPAPHIIIPLQRFQKIQVLSDHHNIRFELPRGTPMTEPRQYYAFTRNTNFPR